MLVQTIPLAIMIYIVVFGDLLIAGTLLKEADKIRPDEKIDINHTRTHYALALRNLGHMLTGGAFIPLHGPMWTGVTVFIVERYKQGRAAMDSIFTGTISWFILAIPIAFLQPVIGLMLPLLPVALSLTLLLTGFACAYVAMAMVQTNTGRGLALLIGMITSAHGPAWGLGIGIIAYILLMGIKTKDMDIP